MRADEIRSIPVPGIDHGIHKNSPVEAVDTAMRITQTIFLREIAAQLATMNEARAASTRGLVAAAPAMYEALEWFVQDAASEGSGDDEYWSKVELGKIALRKARGEM
jgi:hypothetical protein